MSRRERASVKLRSNAVCTSACVRSGIAPLNRATASISQAIPVSLPSAPRGNCESPGSTVGEVIQNLEAKYPGLRDRILDGSGALRRYVNLFHNQDDIRFLQQLATAVKEGDRVSVVPAIAGG